MLLGTAAATVRLPESPGMSVDASAKNMQAVCKAKDAHNASCPYGGQATAVHLSWYDRDLITVR